eukprot:6219771-Amphidinium_carterae.1
MFCKLVSARVLFLSHPGQQVSRKLSKRARTRHVVCHGLAQVYKTCNECIQTHNPPRQGKCQLQAPACL